MKPFIKIMKALSDPSRVKILKMLQRRSMCVCEIQEALGVAQSTASNHLKVLEEAGLATYRKERLWVNYTIAEPTGNIYARVMLSHLSDWLEDEPDINALIHRLPEIRRENICSK
jgi:ArsR family transcriptional regulator